MEGALDEIRDIMADLEAMAEIPSAPTPANRGPNTEDAAGADGRVLENMPANASVPSELSFATGDDESTDRLANLKRRIAQQLSSQASDSRIEKSSVEPSDTP